MKSERINVIIDSKTKAKLKAICAEKSITITDLINKKVLEFIEEVEKEEKNK
ncbi:plasmid partition protein ParG [Cetobacterium sp. ZWU0022]|uniref:plasmid partition protein ParG n=1 Tax=Cetobacterium sp. ZWU0022 TaxID=1340502 RepID=UPI0009DF92E6|nr:plasmid partition protein ParG [Cetobacterium sp. ZWU0022]